MSTSNRCARWAISEVTATCTEGSMFHCPSLIGPIVTTQARRVSTVVSVGLTTPLESSSIATVGAVTPGAQMVDLRSGQTNPK